MNINKTKINQKNCIRYENGGFVLVSNENRRSRGLTGLILDMC